MKPSARPTASPLAPAPFAAIAPTPPRPPTTPRRWPRRWPGWLLTLPVVVLLWVASARLLRDVQDAGSAGQASPERLGGMARDEAVARGEELCVRLTGGVPCELVDLTTFIARRQPPRQAARAAGERAPDGGTHQEWHLGFRTARGECTVRLDADTKELIVFGISPVFSPAATTTPGATVAAPSPSSGGGMGADPPPTDQPGNGDVGALSAGEAERYARHYLMLAGLAAREARPDRVDVNGVIYRFEFRIEEAAEGGAGAGQPSGALPRVPRRSQWFGSAHVASTRLVRVDVNQWDGSLEFLFNHPTNGPMNRRVRSSPSASPSPDGGNPH